MPDNSQPLVLVTGATGYVGGRLVPRLLDAGYRVRCMTRQPERLAGSPWRDRVEIVAADALDRDSLERASAGCRYAYYLIHSMDGSGNFRERDRTAAENFRNAAANAGLERIVYLGGLGEDGEDLSNHLASRQEVGRILATGTVPVTELRAAVIIGSGSVSFEMLRYLTEVLPVMTTPKWVRTRCQPIAIADILRLLVEALNDEERVDRVLEVGGPDVMTYEEMMQVYAEVAGLPKRRILPVPVLSPGLSSLWIGLVTPLPVGVARPLVDSLRNEVVASAAAAPEFMHFEPTAYRRAVELALRRTRDSQVSTRWSGAADIPAAPLPTDPAWSGGTVLRDVQTVETDAAPADLFWAFSRIGGDVGYYTLDWAWRVRGWLDSLVGGVGLRRGRRHPTEIRLGEALDFWRVVAVDGDERLLLRAEMKLPGTAWLAWSIDATEPGASPPRALVQEATFHPKGLFGRLYWYVLFPFHVAIFGRMARKIVAAAEQRGRKAGVR